MEKQQLINFGYLQIQNIDSEIGDLIYKKVPEEIYNEIALNEVKETVEHEVEHLLQTFFEDKYIPHEDSENNLEYLISGREIPAYVKGLVTRARHKKISLDDAMEEWFRENILKFDNPKEDWKIVKSKWMDYANSARQKNQIKKFK